MPGFQQILWIQVCKAFFAGKGGSWVDADDNANALGSQASRSMGVQSNIVEELGHGPIENAVGGFKSSAGTCHSIRRYVYGRVLEHASQYEKEAERSCWPLIHGIMTPIWLKQHLDHPEGKLSDRMLDEVDKFARFGSDLHMSIFYDLTHYLKEALQQTPAIVNSNTEAVIDAVLDDHKHPNSHLIENQYFPPGSKRASLLATAVYHRSRTMSSRITESIHLLAPISPPLQEPDMLMAIAGLSASETKVLLTNYPRGPLKLHSRMMLQNICKFGPRHISPTFPYGPLWAVAYRGGDTDGNAAVLRLSLDRGDDLNGQCGLYGTVLHSAVSIATKHGYTSGG